MAPKPQQTGPSNEDRRSSISMNVGRLSILSTQTQTQASAAIFPWFLNPSSARKAERPSTTSTRTSMASPATPHIVTPSTTPTVGAASPDGSPELLLPPPVVLQRQNSDVSAWFSEVDSHYHSDTEGFRTETDSGSDSEDDVEQRKPVARVPRAVAVAVATVSPPRTEENRPTRAFVVPSQQQSGGDDTSEATSISRRAPRYHIANPKKKQAAATLNNDAEDPSPVLLQVWQQRASQAEERASSLTHRLSLEERLHRQVAEDLRDAKWEASNLQDQVREQEARIHELEQQQRITDEWTVQRSSVAVNDAPSSPSASPDGDTNKKRQLARYQVEQEQAQKRIKELIRDLKRSQDKLLRVEVQKKQLLQELATLQATQQVAAAEAASPRDNSEEQQQQLRAELNHVQSELLELRAAKLAVETRLQDSLAKEVELQQALEQSHRDLADLKYEHEKLQMENQTLTKRVRFSDERMEDYVQRQFELEARYSTLERESQQAAQNHQLEVASLQTSLGKVQSEKENALEQQKIVHDELEKVQEAARKEQLARQELSSQMETTLAAKAELETSYQRQMDEQKALVAEEQSKSAVQKAKWQQSLDATLQQVHSLQQTLEASQGNMHSFESERQGLLEKQEKLQHQLEENQATLQRLEVERTSLTETLEHLHDEQLATSKKLDESEAAKSELEMKVEEAASLAATQEVQAMKERESLEAELQSQRGKVADLEQNVRELKNQMARLVQDKEYLVLQAAELRTALMDEDPSVDREAIIATQADRVRLDSMVHRLEEERNTLQGRLQTSQGKIVDLEAQVERALEEQKPLKEQVNAATDRANLLQATLDATQTRVSSLEAHHEELQVECTSLQENYKESVAKVAALEVSKMDSSSFIEALEEARKVLNRKLQELEQSHAELESQLNKSNDRALESEAELYSKQAPFDNQLSPREGTLASSHKEQVQVQALLFNHGKGISDLRADLTAMLDALNDKTNGREQEVHAVHVSLKEVEATLKQETDKLAAMEFQWRTDSQDKQQLSSAVERYKETVVSLESELNASRAEVEWLKTEQDTLKFVQGDLATKLASTEERLAEVVKERDALQLEVQELKDENRQLVLQIEDVQATCRDLEKKLQLANDRNARLEAEALNNDKQPQASESVKEKVLQIELEEVRSSKKQVEHDLVTAQSSIVSLQSNLRNVEKEARVAQSQAERYQEEQMVLKDEVKTLTEQVESLSLSRDALAAEKESMEAAYKKGMEEMTSRNVQVEAERDSLRDEMRSMKIQIDDFKHEQKRIEDELEQTIRALAACEDQLAKSKKEAARANEERDAALLRQKALEESYNGLQIKMEKLQAAFDNLVVEKQNLFIEKETVSGELASAISEFRRVQASNEKILAHQVELESRNGGLMSQLEQLESQAADLEEEIKTLGSKKDKVQGTADSRLAEKTALLSSLDEEKESLRAELSSLEKEKATVVLQLAESTDRIGQLEERLKCIEQGAQQSSDRQKSLAMELSKLQDEKKRTCLRVADYESAVKTVRAELRAAKTAASEAENKLSKAQEEIDVLVSERNSAVARQAELEVEVAKSGDKLSSLESRSLDVQEQCNVLSSEERVLPESGMVSRDYEVEHLNEAVASAAETISQLHLENDIMASRLSAAEAATALLKQEMDTKEDNSHTALKKIGLKVLEDLKATQHLNEELQASKQDNVGLKRAARYLVKRIRELEAHVDVVDRSFDVPFSLASTPSKGSTRSDSMGSSFSSQELPKANPNQDSKEDDNASIIRVNQKEITLEMHYHDHSGNLVTYDVHSKYTGPIANGLPHGPGVLRFENGDMYLGEFEKGEMEGVGAFAHRQQYCHANQVFFGTFTHNEFQGDIKTVPPLRRVRVQARQ